MVSINIAGGQGITQAIASQLGLSKDDCKKVGLANWQAVMNEVKNAKSANQNADNNSSGNSIFRSGKNYTADVNKLGDKTTFHSNFVVDKGTVEIDDGAWNKIVQILTGKTPEENTPVEEKEPPIEEQPQPTPDEKPDETPEVKDRLVAGKVIKRSVDGEKQNIAIIKQDDKKVRREVNSDGTLGDTLAATKTFGKNKYISGDFPPETKILEREVNGKKSQIGVYKDEDGNKIRKQVITDEQTGKKTLGETLVPISIEGKNKYITQSKFEEQVKTALSLGPDDEIPSDLKPEYVAISGQECIIFKKDGHVMDSKSIREYMNNYKKPAVELSNAQQAPIAGPSEGENPEYDAVVRNRASNILRQTPQETIKDTKPPLNKDIAPKYDYKNDELFQNMSANLQDLEKNIKDFEAKYNIKEDDMRSRLNAMRDNGYSDYSANKFTYKSLKRDYDSYKNVMDKWQDGAKLEGGFSANHTVNGRTLLNVTYESVECVTLKNGKRAYKTEKGTFYPYQNGLPGAEKVPDELIQD